MGFSSVLATRTVTVTGLGDGAEQQAVADAEVHYMPSWAAVPGFVADLLRPGDLLLTVGAGDVTMIGPEVLLRLEHGDLGEDRANGNGSTEGDRL